MFGHFDLGQGISLHGKFQISRGTETPPPSGYSF